MWTVETEYLSAERKAVTGNCIIYGQAGEYIATVPAKVASVIVEAPAMVGELRQLESDWGEAFDGDEPMNGGDCCEWLCQFIERARAILSRIDGATPTDEPATPTGEFSDIPETHRETLIRIAETYLYDLESGLEDGTYDDPSDVEPVKAALAAVKGESALPTADASTCQHCGEERPLGTHSSVWTCGACNGLNCD